MMSNEDINLTVDPEETKSAHTESQTGTLEGQEEIKPSSDADEKAKLNAELAEQKDKFLRLYAEFDNYKRRTTREKLDLIHTAARELLQDILPVVDDMERARRLSEEQNDPHIFPEGIRLVYNKLMGVLKSRGVEAIETTGKEFDPNEQEAITEIPAPTEDLKGKVLDTVEKGYRIHDKMLRFAKVVVGK